MYVRRNNHNKPNSRYHSGTIFLRLCCNLRSKVGNPQVSATIPLLVEFEPQVDTYIGTLAHVSRPTLPCEGARAQVEQ